jgi:AcrR family transcriptional regulator
MREGSGRVSPKTDRRSRQGQESRQRILDATFDIAHERGYAGTSIAEVSARSGLPASSVYWHFASKDELFAEVISHSFEGWWASMPQWRPPPAGRSRADAIAERIQRAVASISANPEFWRLGLMLTLEHQVVEPTARQRFLEIRRFVLDNLAHFWQAVLPPGHEERTPRLPELLARYTMATADGLFVAAQAEGEHDLSVMADLLADSLEAAALRLG